MDRATRNGSYVPVTTIGIAPILGRDQRATNPPAHLQGAAGKGHGIVPPSGETFELPFQDSNQVYLIESEACGQVRQGYLPNVVSFQITLVDFLPARRAR